jgi:hypothetical protein
MAVVQNPSAEWLTEFAAAILHLREFLDLALVVVANDGNFHFVPLCNDDTEFV